MECAEREEDDDDEVDAKAAEGIESADGVWCTTLTGRTADTSAESEGAVLSVCTAVCACGGGVGVASAVCVCAASALNSRSVASVSVLCVYDGMGENDGRVDTCALRVPVSSPFSVSE